MVEEFLAGSGTSLDAAIPLHMDPSVNTDCARNRGRNQPLKICRSWAAWCDLNSAALPFPNEDLEKRQCCANAAPSSTEELIRLLVPFVMHALCPLLT